MKKVKKKVKISKFEKLLYTFTFLLLVASPVAIVFSKATLSEINFEVEKEKKQIAKQKKTNESLAMTIDELASLTKIQEVAEQQGLRYNNSNIKSVVGDSN
ncbi:MAG: cell division protein FtsL [Bacilli bacterium]|nr:cell division protein FtsL [Bacilli bacterium]